jgi:hypothetical protein
MVNGVGGHTTEVLSFGDIHQEFASGSANTTEIYNQVSSAISGKDLSHGGTISLNHFASTDGSHAGESFIGKLNNSIEKLHEFEASHKELLSEE